MAPVEGFNACVLEQHQFWNWWIIFKRQSGGGVEKWLIGLEFKTWVEFPAPTPGSSQLPVTPGLKDLTPSSTLHEYYQTCGGDLIIKNT